MKSISKTLFISLILAIFLAAGCSDASPTENGAQRPSERGSLDPCSLVLQADVDAAIGAQTTIARHDEEPQNATGQKICFYDVESEDAVIAVQMTVQQTRDMAAGLTAAQLFADTKGFLDNVMTVTDVGDEAYQSQMDFVGGGSLYVLTDNGDTLITIDVSHGRLDHAANQKTEKELAQKILENIQ